MSVIEIGGYDPSAGFFPSRLLTTEWEAYSFATIDAAGEVIDPAWVTPTTVVESHPPP